MTKTAMVAGSREGHAETSSCVSKTNYRALVFCHSQHAHVPLVLHGISRRCILIEQLQRIQVLLDGGRYCLVHVGPPLRISLDRSRETIEMARRP